MRNLIPKILLWILRIGLVATLFSPLIYHQYFMFPFIMPRAVYFQIIVEILFGIAVLLAVFWPEYRPKWSLIGKALVLFIIVNLMATLLSADPAKSFIGTFERSFGFFHLIHYAAFFFTSIIAMRTQKQWNAFLWISLLISLWAGVSFLIPALSNSNLQAPSVTGNQLFLAVYILIHVFFAAFLFMQYKNWIVKFVLAAAILINTATIFITGVRGTFIGLCAGIVFLMAYGIWKLPKLRTALGGLLIIVIIGYGFIFINRHETWVKSAPVLNRITNFSLKDETIKARFAMWKMAISGFKERPILGWGRENYSLVFDLHYDASFHAAGVSEEWEDRAHNIVFDELITAGTVGLISYMILIAAVFIAIIKTSHKNSAAVLVALLIAYVTQNLFGVDTLNSFLPLFIFFALVDFSQTKENHNIVPLNKAVGIGIASVAMLAVIFSVMLSDRMIKGNMTMVKAMSYIIDTDTVNFEKTYKEGKELLSYFPTMRMESMAILANNFFQQSLRLNEKGLFKSFVFPVINDLETLTDKNPAEQRFSFILGKIFTLTALATHDTQYLDRGDVVWYRLIATSPNRELYLASLSESQNIRNLMAKAPTE